MNVRVTTEGIPELRATLATLKGGAEAVGKMQVLVGYSKVYAFGIETGYRRSGRLARRAGGAFMLITAFRQVEPDVKPAIADALERGPQAVLNTALRLAYRIEGIARPLTPVGKTRGRRAARGGTLRRDLHTVVGARG